ncbi:MAG: excinuclease ABC subunit UvrA [Opitutales bacterium]
MAQATTHAPEHIHLRGVRQNNLKGFDLDLPLGKLVVVTGLSGTGKSSLVFDTLHAEGQRRYVETFSPYTRQFMEMLDRPVVDSIENIRPSIAIEQTNTVKTSRSTVGTMTELCDFFKVWFCHVAQLHDPQTGEVVEDDNPETIWKKARASFADQEVLVAFAIDKPASLEWATVIDSLKAQGFARVYFEGELHRLETLELPAQASGTLLVIQDRLSLKTSERNRFLEAAASALHFGKGELHLLDAQGAILARYSEGLHAPGSNRRFKPAQPALFSFNSPVGACERCRGFGRVIEIDPRLVIPDQSLSLEDGAVKAFQGEVYRNSLHDLVQAARVHEVRTDVPWNELSEDEQAFVWDGEPGYVDNNQEWDRKWYGIRRFFAWLESNTYKMHVRVFLSKFRAYTRCPDCGGARLKPEALNWKWQGHTLPQLYQMPVGDLLARIQKNHTLSGNRQVDIAAESILTRLTYLDEVGLSYLTLDRTSRTLSGGEVERVNLTTCLGTSLVDTLFVLDEPSVGLHPRDIDRLIGILRQLTDRGNTVVVVEHDEAIMRAADWMIELGPEPGSAGGHITFNGPLAALPRDGSSVTADYLLGARTIDTPGNRRDVQLPTLPARKGARKPRKPTPSLRLEGVSLHNLRELAVTLPLNRLVCLSGVSGSGKSTLLDNVLYQGFLDKAGRSTEEPARIDKLETDVPFSEVVLVDQSPVSRTPRSNPVLFVDAWDEIRNLFARTEAAASAGLTAGHFSFNAGQGRCDNCQGLGYEKIEMQFLSDLYVPCPVCEGRRFKPEVLAVRWNDTTVAEILQMDVRTARTFFAKQARICHRLASLESVGLGYLQLGQPLNTLSGGESQRLKLVRYLTRIGDDADPALILLDEPTTGLHRDDVRRLIGVLQALVDKGHSLVVIEHNLDVLKAADWLIELGPGAGADGGQVVAAGPPEHLATTHTETAPFLREALDEKRVEFDERIRFSDTTEPVLLEAAEGEVAFDAGANGRAHSGHAHNGNGTSNGQGQLVLKGGREHNLRDISVTIPHREITVVTGVSGSGKSTLAFDIVFAEGQRRFMESMSAYARQFVEQLRRPDIDELTGIAPSVAIEQRVTRGSRKSTVATITEVAQYLRLLYARTGVQHSPVSGQPVVSQTPSALKKRLLDLLEEHGSPKHLYLCAPLIRGRKGHHEPMANWAREHGYTLMRIDGKLTELARFERLDRYREHDLELVVADLGLKGDGLSPKAIGDKLEDALRLGKGTVFLLHPGGEILAWLSTRRTDPVTGEAFPELDPKHFSWNSSRGWCPVCRGHGRLLHWMRDDENFTELPHRFEDGDVCPECNGERLNLISRHVRLYPKKGDSFSLPELLNCTPAELIKRLRSLKLDARGKRILREILPEVEERLRFMDAVGLGYLTLDRATITLSGGESQRIRLAAQLGSNLSGVLYVLDEPSIGLHARDNARLIDSLKALRAKGNTLLVVEHDEDTMRAADRIIDLGPEAGVHGGEILANAPPDELLHNGHANSLTSRYLKEGIRHPWRGEYRTLPPAWSPRSRKKEPDWLVLREPTLRTLKGGDLHLPLGSLIVFCGISGAGKSTLMRDLLKPTVSHAARNNLARLTGKAVLQEGLLSAEGAQLNGTPPLKDLHNGHVFRSVIEVDQEPIGKTPRSTPATYIGAFDTIRQFFATLPEARMRGFSAGHFSFNTKGGRCETCKGAGRIKLEMSFMPDTYVDCEDCGGSRYGSEIREILWKGKSIADVLAMSFEEGAAFFTFHKQLKALMDLMVETGLGYLTLGQSSPTLSGGEAQRLKLVSELARGLPTFRDAARGTAPRNLYLLEEPTIGLHLADCEKLIALFHRLVDQGHTVLVIEHHLDVIREADYVVEMGPEGGDAGGEILYQGPLEGLAKVRRSRTAPFLKG